MDQPQSILDRVMSTRHEKQIRDFQPSDLIAQLLKQLSNKEEDILRRRHGLSGQEHQTLEDIGVAYHLTRERIRQIEAGAIAKMKRLKNFEEVVREPRETIRAVLERFGGAMERQHFLDELFHFSSDTELNRSSVIFLMDSLFSDQFDTLPESPTSRAGWKLSSISLETIQAVINKFRGLIESAQKPINSDELISSFRRTFGHEVLTQHLTDEALLSYLQVAADIGQNPFGEYGLASWGTIVPKRMNDKIYLILKKHGQPLHFTKIAELINKAHFDSRRAYPPTIHNELILNDRYVLVGRGIYALKEWGYRSGVVADVLVDILRRSGSPLTRDELVTAVLKQRLVKKNTIHLALTDKTKFTKHHDGRYTLAATPTQPMA